MMFLKQNDLINSCDKFQNITKISSKHPKFHQLLVWQKNSKTTFWKLTLAVLFFYPYPNLHR